MQIALQHIMPKPLLDRLSGRGSDIWNQELIFQQGESIRIKAPSGSGKTWVMETLELGAELVGVLEVAETGS